MGDLLFGDVALYELNIQTLGIHDGDADIIRGDMADGKFTMFHLRDGALIGATLVSDARNKKPALKLIQKSAVIAPDALADASTNLRKLK